VNAWLWLGVVLGAWLLVGGVVAVCIGRIFGFASPTSATMQRRWLYAVPDLEAADGERPEAVRLAELVHRPVLRAVEEHEPRPAKLLG
jgi:hypothetical protein